MELEELKKLKIKIRAKTGMKDIGETVKHLKWKYAGLLTREKRERGPKKCWTGDCMRRKEKKEGP